MGHIVYCTLNSYFITFFTNRSTEHDHVEDSLPSRLQRMRKFGKMPLDEWKPLISPEDWKYCDSAKDKARPTWYFVTKDVFIKFLYAVRQT